VILSRASTISVTPLGCPVENYLAGINVETPYRSGKYLSETEFLPWQVFIQNGEGKCEVLNQVTLMHELREASPVNPDTINLNEALQQWEPDEQ
jgi:hypothetical protein